YHREHVVPQGRDDRDGHERRRLAEVVQALPIDAQGNVEREHCDEGAGIVLPVARVRSSHEHDEEPQPELLPPQTPSKREQPTCKATHDPLLSEARPPGSMTAYPEPIQLAWRHVREFEDRRARNDYRYRDR